MTKKILCLSTVLLLLFTYITSFSVLGTSDPGSMADMNNRTGVLKWTLSIQESNGTYRNLDSNTYYIASPITPTGTKSFATNSNVQLSIKNIVTNNNNIMVSATVLKSKKSNDYVRYADGTIVKIKETKKGKHYNYSGEDINKYSLMLDGSSIDVYKAKDKYTKTTMTIPADGFPERYTVYVNKRTAQNKYKNTEINSNTGIRYDLDAKVFDYYVSLPNMTNMARRNIGTNDPFSQYENAFKLSTVVSQSNTMMYNYLASRACFDLGTCFTRGQGFYDIGVNYQFNSSFSTYLEDFSSYKRCWSVGVQSSHLSSSVSVKLNNTSSVGGTTTARNVELPYIISGTGVAPFEYKVTYVKEADVTEKDGKYTVKKDATIMDVAHESNVPLKTEAGLIKDGVSMEFTENGTYYVIIALKDSKSAFISKYFKVDVVDANDLLNNGGSEASGANSGTEEESVIPDRTQIEANRELTFDEQKRVDEINKNRQNATEMGLWSWVYTFSFLCGICLLIYSLLLLVSFYIDIFNSFSDFSLTRLITFGRMYPVGSKRNIDSLNLKQEKDSKIFYTTNVTIWISFCIGVIASALLMNAQTIIIAFLDLANWFNNILS